MFKKHYTKATESAKNFYNSEDTQELLGSSKGFFFKSMEKPIVKHVLYAALAGGFIGAALPILSVGFCATAGAALGAYKFATK